MKLFIQKSIRNVFLLAAASFWLLISGYFCVCGTHKFIIKKCIHMASTEPIVQRLRMHAGGGHVLSWPRVKLTLLPSLVDLDGATCFENAMLFYAWYNLRCTNPNSTIFTPSSPGIACSPGWSSYFVDYGNPARENFVKINPSEPNPMLCFRGGSHYHNGKKNSLVGPLLGLTGA